MSDVRLQSFFKCVMAARDDAVCLPFLSDPERRLLVAADWTNILYRLHCNGVSLQNTTWWYREKGDKRLDEQDSHLLVRS